MYEAIVCRLENVRKHPNADRIKLADANGFQVVVGLDSQDGDLGVFFPSDGQLSEEMCKANDLVGYTDPITHERRGGYFPKSRRVRSQNFRGEKSEGYWTPVSAFDFVGKINLNEGDKFTELNGIPICNKYYTPATLRQMASASTKPRKDNKCFAKHVDTVQIKYVDSIPEGSILYFTEKLHGTSGRVGRVIEDVPVKRNVLDRILRRTRTEKKYVTLIGTRNTVLGESATGFYGNEQFRRDSVESFKDKLHKGEVVYYELVGYTTTGSLIMGAQDTSSLKDKTIVKRFGPKMIYKYGQPEGTCGLYVYRITRTDEDGNAIDLSWPQVKKRAGELGIKTVPELDDIPWVFGEILSADWTETVDMDLVNDYLSNKMEGSSKLDDTHIREGVVMRIENEYGTTFVKSKSFTFGLLEGYLKDSDDYVDLEEAS